MLRSRTFPKERSGPQLSTWTSKDWSIGGKWRFCVKVTSSDFSANMSSLCYLALSMLFGSVKPNQWGSLIIKPRLLCQSRRRQKMRRPSYWCSLQVQCLTTRSEIVWTKESKVLWSFYVVLCCSMLFYVVLWNPTFDISNNLQIPRRYLKAPLSCVFAQDVGRHSCCCYHDECILSFTLWGIVGSGRVQVARVASIRIPKYDQICNSHERRKLWSGCAGCRGWFVCRHCAESWGLSAANCTVLMPVLSGTDASQGAWVVWNTT